MTTVSHVSEKIDSDSTEAAGAELHNSDLRDYHEYIQKQVWDEQIFTRQRSMRFDLVETMLPEACSIVHYDSTQPQYLVTNCI